MVETRVPGSKTRGYAIGWRLVGKVSSRIPLTPQTPQTLPTLALPFSLQPFEKDFVPFSHKSSKGGMIFRSLTLQKEITKGLS